MGQQVATRRIGVFPVDGRVRRIGQLISSYPTTKAVAVGKTYKTVPRVWRTVANVRTGQTNSGQVKKYTKTDMDDENFNFNSWTLDAPKLI